MAHGEAAIRDKYGRWLLRTEVENMEKRFGAPSFALHRADLHEMLEKAALGAKLRTGHYVTGIRNGLNPTVTFHGPDGSSEDSADLVVGSDGIKSRIREALFPDHPGLAYAGYITWRGLVPANSVPHAPSELGITESWGRGRRFGIVPLGNGQIYWFASGSFPEGSHKDDDLDDLRERFGDWHEPILALLDATPSETLLRHDIYYLKTPLPCYNSGNVVLLGDAAHALTPDIGQGGCLALEDAVTLIDVLSRQTDVADALVEFDRGRRPRTQKIVRVSALWGRIAEWSNPVAATIRNILVGLLPPSLFLWASEDTLGWKPPPRFGTPAAGKSATFTIN
jgi:2-polyprenyl-6-methoxyphenol hydroxylase-like FAD-dependent oxidoreductase